MPSGEGASDREPYASTSGGQAVDSVEAVEHGMSMFEFAGHAHNAYVETLLTTGFVGLGILLALLAYSVFVVRKSGDSLLLSMIVFIYLASIFNPLILTPNPSSFCLLFALFLAAGPSVPSYAVDEPR